MTLSSNEMSVISEENWELTQEEIEWVSLEGVKQDDTMFSEELYGNMVFELWLTTQENQWTVYDLIQDFNISEQQLEETLASHVYEAYMEYWKQMRSGEADVGLSVQIYYYSRVDFVFSSFRY